MHVTLKLVPTDIVNIEGPPQPCFQLGASVTNSSDVPLAILGLSFGVRVAKGNLRVQPDRACTVADYEARLAPGASIRVYLPFTFTKEVLTAIESSRGVDGEVAFRLNATALVAPIVGRREANETVLTLGLPESKHLAVQAPDGRDTYTVSRDAWLGCLRAFEFSDLELFELPTLRMKDKGLPPEALTLLRSAEQAFRAGDWDGTLAKTRSAFEAVATGAANSADLRNAFKVLWAGLLPDQVDDAKRSALDELVGGITPFQHLGRHKKFPFTPVDREDALLALRISLSIFEYMGARAERLP